MDPIINIDDEYVIVPLRLGEGGMEYAMQVARSTWALATGSEYTSFTCLGTTIIDRLHEGEYVYDYHVNVVEI